jgi:NADH-quinone oxidoreductase subunit M
MFGNYITIPHLLIIVPLLAGIVAFFIRDGQRVQNWSVFFSIITLGLAFLAIYYAGDEALSGRSFNYVWLKYLGASLSLSLDGVGRLLVLLTAICFPLILLRGAPTTYGKSNMYFGLMLLSQAGMLGVFLATDALLFYFFWELALIPVYFLCSRWGGEKRIAATFKFFIYTFAGSLLMLGGIIYLYFQTVSTGDVGHSFSIAAFHSVLLKPMQQYGLFALFFLAFAIKMPVFPFHTWQPDTYEQSPTPVTMVLSGLMVKMGLFGVIRWVLPVFPAAVLRFDTLLVALSLFGVVYASLIAIRQDDLKRLLAFSSIAHIGLMAASLFTARQLAMEGAILQLFSHGINIIGLWMVVDCIERQFGVRKISQLGGLARKAPALTIFAVVIALANIALPLTNAFVGEFMMLAGLFRFHAALALLAGAGIILSAVYTLNMIKGVFLGETNPLTEKARDLTIQEQLAFSVVVVAILVVGIFPGPMIALTRDTVSFIMTRYQ